MQLCKEAGKNYFTASFILERKDMEFVDVEGVGRVKVRKGAHIRFLTIRIAAGKGVWVNVPHGVSKRQLRDFLSEKKEWILQTREQIKQYERETGLGVKIGAEINTKLHVLKVAASEGGKLTYRIEGKYITLWIPRETDSAGVEEIVKKFVLEIYRMECRRLLPDRVRFLAEKYGFTYTRLSFRNNVSNWGSCSRDDHISLNIKLMKLPDELIDYVILHELCHTLEKNHSAAFWALVKKVCPDYVAYRRALRTYNTRL